MIAHPASKDGHGFARMWRGDQRQGLVAMQGKPAAERFRIDRHAAFLDFDPADAPRSQRGFYPLDFERQDFEHLERREQRVVDRCVAGEIRNPRRDGRQSAPRGEIAPDARGEHRGVRFVKESSDADRRLDVHVAVADERTRGSAVK